MCLGQVVSQALWLHPMESSLGTIGVVKGQGGLLKLLCDSGNVFRHTTRAACTHSQIKLVLKSRRTRFLLEGLWEIRDTDVAILVLSWLYLSLKKHWDGQTDLLGNPFLPHGWRWPFEKREKSLPKQVHIYLWKPDIMGKSGVETLFSPSLHCFIGSFWTSGLNLLPLFPPLAVTIPTHCLLSSILGEDYLLNIGADLWEGRNTSETADC